MGGNEARVSQLRGEGRPLTVVELSEVVTQDVQAWPHLRLTTKSHQ